MLLKLGGENNEEIISNDFDDGGVARRGDGDCSSWASRAAYR